MGGLTPVFGGQIKVCIVELLKPNGIIEIDREL